MRILFPVRSVNRFALSAGDFRATDLPLLGRDQRAKKRKEAARDKAFTFLPRTHDRAANLRMDLQSYYIAHDSAESHSN
jgi:hypothetical protein